MNLWAALRVDHKVVTWVVLKTQVDPRVHKVVLSVVLKDWVASLKAQAELRADHNKVDPASVLVVLLQDKVWKVAILAAVAAPVPVTPAVAAVKKAIATKAVLPAVAREVCNPI